MVETIKWIVVTVFVFRVIPTVWMTCKRVLHVPQQRIDRIRTLGASKIPQLFVWISLQANPIPLGYIKADIKL